MLVFQWFRCFVGSPHLGPLASLLLASCWPLAGLLASCWLQASHEDFSRNSVFHKARKTGEFSSWKCLFLNGFGVSCGPPHLGPLPGLLLASCWPLAGFVLASLAGLLASCWPLAGVLLASCWPSFVLASLAGLLLASCWLLPGLLLASCWLLAGLLASD